MAQFLPPPIVELLRIPSFLYKQDPNFMETDQALGRQNENAVKKFGPVYKLIMASTGIVIVNDIDFAKQVAVKGSKLVAKAEGLSSPTVELLGNNIFVAWEDIDWKRFRTLLNHAFSDSALECVATATAQSTHRLIDLIDSKLENRNVFEDTSSLTIDVIGLAGFGFPFEAWKRNSNNFTVSQSASVENRTLSEHTSNYLKTASVHAMLPSKFLRSHLKIGPFKLFHEAVDAFKRIVNELIENRKNEMKSGQEYNHRDILSLLVNSSSNSSDKNEEEEEPKPLTNQEMISNLVIFLLAGHETTARALVFVLYLLCTHPEVQQKAQQHVDSILENRRDPTLADFEKLTYLQHIIRETLRLYPVTVGIIREAKQEFQVKGYTVPTESSVLLLWSVYCRSPDLFEKPEEFIPERFEDENNENLMLFRTPTFGVGNRSCIGKRFAMIEATLSLAMLLQRYSMKLSNSNYVMKTKVLVTMQPEEDLYITFSKRE